MDKFICIHGHFYQPPRENPWLEAVELQDSAAPYHDWNERITAECYAPNAYARLMDGSQHIRRIVNNYSKMSFNFGPTLLSWLKGKSPDIHAAIIEGDKEGQKRFSGHGTALAQCYNHIIMPLANRRDKFTQVVWGITDFESRFERKPEGMWLAETAADDETLDVLAEMGMKFTILSPFQASRIKPLDRQDWQDVNGGRIDPSMPYLAKLPSGRSITVFFYDAGVAKAVAFEGVLASGEALAHRLMGAFDDCRGRDQLVSVATDGESYGHHFIYGDMALAYALHYIEQQGKANLTVYAEYLEKHPPTVEVQIHQGSAWSCSHGVGRWWRDCGCNSGGHRNWNQRWREPLRNALDWLREKLVKCYEERIGAFLRDPWTARNAYVSVILDRSPQNLARFFSEHATRELNQGEQTNALRLLEMQRHSLLMYTSCGWFFDELSGIETVQVIQYAARAIQLAAMFCENYEQGFLDILGRAESNLPDPHDGRQIYDRFVKPAVMTRETIVAHYAMSSLFQSYPPKASIYAFVIEQQDRQSFTMGKTRLATGRVKITFKITRFSELLTYAVFHTGDHTINCAVRDANEMEIYQNMVQELRNPFEHSDFPEVIRVMDRHFGSRHYCVHHLFRDEQRTILDYILDQPRTEIYNTLRHIADFYAPLRRFLADLSTPPIKELRMASEIVLNTELRQEIGSGSPNLERIRGWLEECALAKVPLYTNDLAYAVKAHCDQAAADFAAEFWDMDCLDKFVNAAELAKTVPLEVNLWKAQNIYFEMLNTALPEMLRAAAQGKEEPKTWVEKFRALGNKLGFAPDIIPEIPQPAAAPKTPETVNA